MENCEKSIRVFDLKTDSFFVFALQKFSSRESNFIKKVTNEIKNDRIRNLNFI